MARDPLVTCITMPRVSDEGLDSPERSRRKPFEDLLILLTILERNDRPPSRSSCMEGQYFCLKHTHDLSELSEIFLSVHVPGVRYKINIYDIQFEGPRSALGRIFVHQLEEYAHRVLARVKVSISTSSQVKSLDKLTWL